VTDQDAHSRLVALRGATTVDDDVSDEIKARTAELLQTLFERNSLSGDDLVSVVFTSTPDLRADFPAVAAREIGLSHIPLLCAQEIPVVGAIGHCVRVLVHCYLPGGRGPSDAHHVYLHGARQLRLDLPE
jgi:chorismate mutase